jgi:hypothetical protein
MKAAFIEQYGGPEVLKFGDLPDPVVATPRSNSPTVSGRRAIRPPEIKLYRLSEAADAHRLSESRHFRGKLVFQVA